MKEKKLRYIPVSWKKEIVERQDGLCAGETCKKDHGKKIDIRIRCNFDHTKPLAMGGRNIESNLKAYCAICHQKKSEKDRQRIKKWKEKQKEKKKKSRKRKIQKKNQIKLHIPKEPFNPKPFKF